MVEVKLDLAKESAAASDLYVSVRVGDVQKLSRLSQSRTYRFPKAADQGFGKIEVFKRIGVCAVHVNSLSNEVKDIQVPVTSSTGESQNIAFQVSVDGDDSTKAQAAKKRELDESANAKTSKAKEYLQKHCIEVVLSEAMQTLLRERPENPTAFLASALAAYTGTTVKSKPKAQAPPEPSKAPAPVPAPTKASAAPKGKAVSASDCVNMPASAFAKIYSKFPEQPKPVKVMPRFPMVSAACMNKLYAKFPQPKKPAPVKAMPRFALVPDSSMQKLYAKFPQKKPAQEMPRYALVPESSMNKLYAKFPQKAPAQVGQAPAPGAAKGNFMHKASVGTWVMPLRKQAPAIEAPKAVGGAADAGFKETWKHKPSTGTWLAARQKPVAGSAAAAAAGAPATNAAPKRGGMMILNSQLRGPSFAGTGICII
eukprot:TRINITY_DN8049_c0_g2_i1.p1 TRINITY_DN8049_c0_g2~~TRINITY_DN8049_c0_g2_i1.p1  ORF type:complete len:449 (-),score=114.94 TRINITY_DN8049_c0_g2_i1:73-1347(-)